MGAKKIAFCITGGGAHISQQAAICEFLVTRKGKVPEIFSGTSAGGLLTVAIDSILAGRWTWESLKDQLFKLKNDEVYKKIPPLNMALKIMCKRLPAWYDTAPERELFKKILGEIGISKLKEINKLSYISGVRNSDGYDTRWCNRNPPDGELKIEDVLMGTSAIPFKFSPQQVPAKSGQWYVDGGAGRDFSPLEVLFQHDLDEIYIITPAKSKHPHKVDSMWIVDNVFAAVDHMLVDLFDLQIDYYPRLDPKTDYYVIQPLFEYQYSSIDFEKGKEQYNEAWKWIEQNFSKIKPQPKDWPPKRAKANPRIEKVLELIKSRESKKRS